MTRPADFPIATGTADAAVLLRILSERREECVAALIYLGIDERRSDTLRGRIAELDEFIDWLTPPPE